MKYIRTKDGIYKDKQYQLKHIAEKNSECFVIIEEKEILKQADTIEELCDEFVAIGFGLKGKPAVVIGNNGFSTIKTLVSDYEIYGAIWTDKGLIYVAKMNAKGELELL